MRQDCAVSVSGHRREPSRGSAVTRKSGRVCMSKTMLINMTHAEESRVGIVTNGVLTSFEIESASREHLKGNIYKAVVHRIHPALEAAFVDIGAGRDAFLPLDEICFRNLPEFTREGNGDGRRRLRIKDVLKPGQEVLVQIVKEE